MNWSIHHVNLEAQDVQRTAAFYAAIMGMDQRDWAFPATRGYLPGDPDKLALFGDGRQSHTGLHLIAPDDDFATKNAMSHNPSKGGHVAFQVDDLDTVIARLEAANIRYSLTGEFAIPGMRHLYVEDPEGNLLEINERLPVTEAPTSVRHVVLCKVIDGRQSAFAEVMTELDGLRDRLIMGPMVWGPNASPEGLDRGYSHVFSIDYPTAKERDAYLVHPDHKALGAKLVALCEGGVDGLCVVDF
jgi:catechol 2,3-dioxygenase-like lactoylglutathione lyase family enzyme